MDELASLTVTGGPGEIIFGEGDASTEMYVIREGQIEILKSEGDDRRALAVLREGDFFGEAALLEGKPRQTWARSKTDYRLVKLDRETFERLVDELPQIAVEMARGLSQRLRSTQAAVAPATGATGSRPAAGAPAVGRASLRHDKSGGEFSLKDSGDTLVGRADRKSGYKPDVDLTDVDEHRTLSRKHAVVSRGSDGFSVCEEKPTANGTFVNDERIDTGTPVPIHDGDKIRFGYVEVVFRCG